MIPLLSQPYDEQRRDTRHPADHLCAFVRMIGKPSHNVVEGHFTKTLAPLIDISQSGASLISMHPMEPGQRIKIDIMGYQKKAAGVLATVKRVHSLAPGINRIGVEFDLSDSANNRHLADIVLYASLLGVSLADW